MHIPVIRPSICSSEMTAGTATSVNFGTYATSLWSDMPSQRYDCLLVFAPAYGILQSTRLPFHSKSFGSGWRGTIFHRSMVACVSPPTTLSFPLGKPYFLPVGRQSTERTQLILCHGRVSLARSLIRVAVAGQRFGKDFIA